MHGDSLEPSFDGGPLYSIVNAIGKCVLGCGGVRWPDRWFEYQYPLSSSQGVVSSDSSGVSIPGPFSTGGYETAK